MFIKIGFFIYFIHYAKEKTIDKSGVCVTRDINVFCQNIHGQQLFKCQFALHATCMRIFINRSIFSEGKKKEREKLQLVISIIRPPSTPRER